MRLDYIKVVNFFTHKDTEIDFRNIGSPLLVSGVNGTGKTTLVLESFSYALFGELRLQDVEEAIRHNEDTMSVTVGLHINGQDLTIVRSKKRGKSQKLALYIDDVKIDELLGDLQKRIYRIVNLSPASFRSSILLRQDDANFFAKTKSDERKQIISEILDLQQYERLEKIARDRRTELKSSIKANNLLLENIEQVDIDDLENQLVQLDKVLTKTTKKLEEQEEAYNIIRSANLEIQSKINNRNKIIDNNKLIENKVKQGNTKHKDNLIEQDKLKQFLEDQKVEDAEKLSYQIEQLSADIEALDSNIEDHQSDLKELITEQSNTCSSELREVYSKAQQHTSNIVALEKKLSNLDKLESTCPTCLRDISCNELSHLQKEYDDEINTEKQNAMLYKNKQYELEQRLKELQSGNFSEAKQLNKIITTYKTQRSSISTQKQELNNSYLKSLKQVKAIAEAKQKLQNIIDNNTNLQKDIAFLTTQIQDIPKVSEELHDETQVKQKIQTFKNQQREAIEFQGKIKNTIQRSRSEKEKSERILEDIRSAVSELELVELLVMAYSKNGIPASIIETVLPEIEEIANEYLDKMTEDTLEFKFSTTSILKNGDEKNTLDLAVFDGTTYRPFDSLSGGEGFRVSLAIRLALSQILSRRSGVELETLILDEPAQNLDQSGRESFCSIIKSLGNIFPRIILTTHIPQLSSEFENKIELVKDSGVVSIS